MIAAPGHRRGSHWGARFRRAAALATVLAAGWPARASADEDKAPPTPESLPKRTAKLVTEQKIVKISVSFRDVVDAEIQKKLLSGLPTVITMRGYVFLDGTTSPIALTAKSCRIVYDLWDEVFRIQLTQPGGQKNTVAVNVEGVLRICGEARKMPLVEKGLTQDGRRYFVAGLVEVNPISQDTLDRIRRWVTRPQGTAAIGPGDSLFGSFVGLFVARIEDADRKLSFRTQAFVPPKEEPPET